MICECGRQYRNWTGEAKQFLCKCGAMLQLAPDDGQTLSQASSKPPEQTLHQASGKLPEPVCQHRGQSAGRASCGCGTIFHCDHFGTYCGDREIVEFATIGADVLTKENYRRCSNCDQFSQ